MNNKPIRPRAAEAFDVDFGRSSKFSAAPRYHILIIIR